MSKPLVLDPPTAGKVTERSPVTGLARKLNCEADKLKDIRISLMELRKALESTSNALPYHHIERLEEAIAGLLPTWQPDERVASLNYSLESNRLSHEDALNDDDLLGIIAEECQRFRGFSDKPSLDDLRREIPLAERMAIFAEVLERASSTEEGLPSLIEAAKRTRTTVGRGIGSSENTRRIWLINALIAAIEKRCADIQQGGHFSETSRFDFAKAIYNACGANLV